MIKIYLLLLLIFITLPADPGKNYLWPTNSSEYMSSSFCEYRSGRYHAAIDIKTWNQEGYPCYAIEDGMIDRIRVSPFGYGKVLYLKLNDGNTAVYAHLQRFVEALDEEVQNRQIENERYSLSWNAINWPVKKGQIIGYTGQTGIGVPHLHLEIRDEHDRPMNPLHFYSNIRDTKPPVLRSLLVVPQDHHSRINGSLKEEVFPLTYVKNQVYRITEPLRAFGRIGLAVEGYDMADEVYNKYAFYEMVLEVNGETFFHSRFDYFDFDVNHQADIEIFYPQKVENNKVFNKLFIEPYNELPFYDRSLGSGLIDIRHSDTPFTIHIRDFMGNTSSIEGVLQAAPRNWAKTQMMNKLHDLVYMRLDLPHELKHLQFKSSTDGTVWHEVNYFEILERSFNPHEQNMLLKVRLNSSSDAYIKTIITNTHGQTMEKRATFDLDFNHQTNLTIQNLGKYITLQFDPLKDLPGLGLHLINDLTNHTIQPVFDGNRYDEVIDAFHFLSSPLHVSLSGSEQTFSDTTLNYHVLLPRQMQQFRFFDDSCRIFTVPESIYDTLLFEAHREPITDSSEIDIPILSSLVRLNGAPQAMKKGLQLELKYRPDPNFPHRRVGLYGINKHNKLSLISSRLDSLDHTIAATIRHWGRFVIAADTIPPLLEINQPREGIILKTMRPISFKTRDNLSGIGSDRNVRVLLNDRFVLSEWDPELDTVFAKPHWTPEKGRQEIRLIISDVAGNVTDYTYHFFLE